MSKQPHIPWHSGSAAANHFKTPLTSTTATTANPIVDQTSHDAEIEEDINQLHLRHGASSSSSRSEARIGPATAQATTGAARQPPPPTQSSGSSRPRDRRHHLRDDHRIAVGGRKLSSSKYDSDSDSDEDDDKPEVSEDSGLDSGLDLEIEDPLEMATWQGQPSIKGSTEPVRMLLLTFVMIGITFTWGVEMTYCTPYLLSLGLTKSKTSLVWIAGPLSGIIVQPIVGTVSDESTSKWGRRRPLIFGCAMLVALGLLVLGWTAEIIETVIPDEDAAKTPTVVLAVFSIYAVDFAINAVMSCSRSLIVDTLAMEKQQSGAAWASRIGALGHMIGYGFGAMDMVSVFGTTFGDTQFKQLTVMAATGMVVCSCVTCWAVTERVLVSVQHDPKHGDSKLKPLKQIWSTLLHLPPRIRAICWAQFWSWIGWFPFLFYSTTWVGETYFRYDLPEGKGGDDALGDIGRVGSTSLVIYSTITFMGAWLLPLVVQSPEDEGYTARPPESIKGFLETWQKYKPDLLTVWIAGHLMFAGAMFLTPFAKSFSFATVLVAFCGIPWSIAMWAPVTFLGVEVNRLSGGSGLGAGTAHSGPAYRRLSNSSIELSTMDHASSPSHLENGVTSSNVGGHPAAAAAAAATGEKSSGELSGIYFGILNIYTTIPQFLGTFISGIVFAILEPGKSPELAHDAHPDEHHGTDGPNAIAVCFVIGACCAVLSARVTRRLRDV